MAINKTVLIIFIISIALRIGFLFVPQDMWHDASFSVLFAQEPDSYMLDSNDVHPPLYYIYLKLFLLISDHEWYIRFTSILAWVGFYFFSYKLLNLKFKRPIPEITLWFLTISPTMVYFSLEPRNYMLGMFFVVAQLYYYFKDKSDWYMLFSSLMLFTHYFTAFVLVVQTIFSWNMKKHWERILAMLPIYAILAYYFLKTMTKVHSMWFKDIDITSLVSTFAFQFVIPDISYELARLVLVFVLSAFAIVIIFKYKVNKFFITLFVLPVITVFTISQITEIYHHRFFLFFAIGLYAFIAESILLLTKKYWEYFVALFSIAMIAGLLIMPNYFPTELKEASRYITDNRTLYHTSPFSQTPFKYYLSDNNHMLITNLSKQERFTAGGAIIKDSEVINYTPVNITVVTDTHSCVYCYENITDSKVMKYKCQFCSDKIIYNQRGLIIYET